ncbi:MAG: flagellar hook-associated protein FlgK [Lachnospiraceae bacterium]|jgi:flagellar hook-associated protein 1 FlgK|nr:flagellar hook-associated protein FlgK [Lachnospiraceae bacterium]
MANGMGTLYVGKSGLVGAQNAINTTANNLTNVNTKGYVREQVVFNDMEYSTLALTKKSHTTNQSVNMKQSGLGVTIGDVVHSRDLFLDKYYRAESGRQSFYEACYTTTSEIHELLQETEGEQFQEVLAKLNEAIQELAKEPGSAINQNLVIQKATLFVERSQALYDGLKEYQLNMNKQIMDTTNRINEIGKKISDYNEIIMRVEAGKMETAMTLRDERDLLLDELGTLANVTYAEVPGGCVKVKLEGVDFVDEICCHQMDFRVDDITGFATPIWKELSNYPRKEYVDVFDFSNDISTELNTDIGKLKGLVMSRGTDVADFRNLYGLTEKEFQDTTGLSPVMTVQAQVDSIVRDVVNKLNDLFSPTVEKEITYYDAKEGKNVTRTLKVWDEENGTVGNTLKGPGEELFSRRFHSRYREVIDTDGNRWYALNEEDLGPVEYDDAGNPIGKDDSTYYNLKNIIVNPILIDDEGKLPTFEKNGEESHRLMNEMKHAWKDREFRLTPGSLPISIEDYYDNMVGAQATNGNVFNGVSRSLSDSVTAIGNQREQVIGVSSDEELSNMIKYQSAYNAASRFINTVDSMIEHIITQLGS